MSTGEGAPTDVVCNCGVSKFHLRMTGICMARPHLPGMHAGAHWRSLTCDSTARRDRRRTQ